MVPWHAEGACCVTYFRKMPKKVLNLELSSGGFSAAAPGVEAREAALEGVAEFVDEPGRAFSGARSAILAGLAACSGVRLRMSCAESTSSYIKQTARCRRIVAVRGPAGDLSLAAREALT